MRGKELQEARLNLDILHQDKANLEAEQGRFAPAARVDPATVQAQLVEARAADQLREKQVLDAQREHALLESQQEQRDKLRRQYLDKDGERAIQKLLADLLGRDRLQLYLVRQAERQVVEFANAVLDRLSGGELSLRLSGEAEGEGSTARALELEAYNRCTGMEAVRSQDGFQSLFWWIALLGTRRAGAPSAGYPWFQSLFWWIALLGRMDRPRTGWP